MLSCNSVVVLYHLAYTYGYLFDVHVQWKNVCGFFDWLAPQIIYMSYFLQQVCDPNGRWYLADGGSAPGDLLLLTGKALSHATAGLRPAASYRAAPDYMAGTNGSGRYKLS